MDKQKAEYSLKRTKDILDQADERIKSAYGYLQSARKALDFDLCDSCINPSKYSMPTGQRYCEEHVPKELKSAVKSVKEDVEKKKLEAK